MYEEIERTPYDILQEISCLLVELKGFSELMVNTDVRLEVIQEQIETIIEHT